MPIKHKAGMKNIDVNTSAGLVKLDERGCVANEKDVDCKLLIAGGLFEKISKADAKLSGVVPGPHPPFEKPEEEELVDDNKEEEEDFEEEELEEEEAEEPSTEEYLKSLNKKELRALAAENNVDVPDKAKKSVLVEALSHLEFED